MAYSVEDQERILAYQARIEELQRQIADVRECIRKIKLLHLTETKLSDNDEAMKLCREEREARGWV